MHVVCFIEMSNTWMQQDDEWGYKSESPSNGVCVGLCRKKTRYAFYAFGLCVNHYTQKQRFTCEYVHKTYTRTS